MTSSRARRYSPLAAASGPIGSDRLALEFRQGKRVGGKIAALLASLTRLGHLATSDGGRTFSLRRVA
ncbi:hypothetical protein [Microvirga alba]|uniref:Uncharacterized protein n=1 Tax=Microvirga alba TaxID=2791025 RepID=A0A931BNZ3_9HYPH|nr:hypothetical protein [Microvirga alba]MBF9234311.1 hypothetical protein [Microvirga alba]